MRLFSFCILVTSLVLANLGWESTWAETRLLMTSVDDQCLPANPSAVITGLDDFKMLPLGTDGAASTLYRGSDQFLLETNIPVQIQLTSTHVENGSYLLDTGYTIDGAATDVLTWSNLDEPSSLHSISAHAVLGQVADQLAGTYSARLVMTVLPAFTDLPDCPGEDDKSGYLASGLTGNPDAEPAVSLSPARNDIANEADSQVHQDLVAQTLASTPEQYLRFLHSGGAAPILPLLPAYLDWMNNGSDIADPRVFQWWAYPSVSGESLRLLIER